jgi:iron complex transport system substrate-binding protein
LVEDDTGRRIELAQPAARVISLAPHATELLYAVGAGGALVATSDFSDYPAEARNLPRIGGAQGLDLERIAQYHPDLVVAWTSGNNGREIEAIERMGVPVFRSDPHSFEGIAQSLEKFGLLTGHVLLAHNAALGFRERIEALRTRYAHRSSVRVFYQVWNRPLMTVGAPHLISHVIALCGGHNIFEDLDALAPRVDPEAVVARDPMVIAVASDLGRGREELAAWNAWPSLSAVRDQHLLILDPALITRATPRIVEGATQLCAGIDAARTH